ncbi:hypothetical protein HYD27_22985 [Paenibacillus sp. S150]|nr:recombinase family protein [Paenibacillus sp. S150]MBW4084203.1 hypothetical protein [Paenibacillus sp. S150]
MKMAYGRVSAKDQNPERQPVKFRELGIEERFMFDSRKFKSMGDFGKVMEDQFLSLLAYVAEQERKKNRQRQAEGIELAQAEGITFGRPRRQMDEAFFKSYMEWRAGHITATAAMQQCGMSKPTFTAV